MDTTVEKGFTEKAEKPDGKRKESGKSCGGFRDIVLREGKNPYVCLVVNLDDAENVPESGMSFSGRESYKLLEGKEKSIQAFHCMKLYLLIRD